MIILEYFDCNEAAKERGFDSFTPGEERRERS